MAFMEALEQDFTDAGLVEFCSTQLDSVVVGSMIHQYYSKKKFGEGLLVCLACTQLSTLGQYMTGVMYWLTTQHGRQSGDEQRDVLKNIGILGQASYEGETER